MQSLRLKQRVLEVQSRVFKRRNTTESTTEKRPQAAFDKETEAPAPAKTVTKAASIISTASSLCRRSTTRKSREATEIVGKERADESRESEKEKEKGKGKGNATGSKRESVVKDDSSPSRERHPVEEDQPKKPPPPQFTTPDHGHDSNNVDHHSQSSPSTSPNSSPPRPSPLQLSAPAIVAALASESPPSPSSDQASAAPPSPTPASPNDTRSTFPSSSDTAPRPSSPTSNRSNSLRRPSQIVRRQSLLPATESKLIHNLLRTEQTPLLEEPAVDIRTVTELPVVMAVRKIWVKRPNASPTAVTVGEDDLVDDARDVILRKYQNTLGRHYDAPDIQLRISPRGSSRPRSIDHGRHADKILSPDEQLLRAIEEYYPGGQSADEALVIEVPNRRTTPRPSPSHAHSYTYGAHEPGLVLEGPDYFSVPVSAHSQGTPGGQTSAAANQPSMSILTTGQIPPIPGSPGRKSHRPALGRRMHTSSPTLHNSVSGAPNVNAVMMMPRQNRSRVLADSTALSTPAPLPAPSQPTSSEDLPRKVATPPPTRVGSPPACPQKGRKKKEHPTPAPPTPASIHTDGGVPPIKVLIVEDNNINLRLLEAFMKRLKVRWESAVNGKIAVDKWRAGGFHLVLMDIQLPVMNGLEATKEIRRLERVNRIGSFPHTKLLDEKDDEPIPEEIPEEDKLPNSILLRSPVIIVALTASSLQSDRHEAYAAGCNDFLTKPVNFIWLERKVTEWGCMQALIDFDGWKKWRDNPENQVPPEPAKAKNKRMMGRKKAGGGGNAT